MASPFSQRDVIPLEPFGVSKGRSPFVIDGEAVRFP